MTRKIIAWTIVCLIIVASLFTWKGTNHGPHLDCVNVMKQVESHVWKLTQALLVAVPNDQLGNILNGPKSGSWRSALQNYIGSDGAYGYFALNAKCQSGVFLGTYGYKPIANWSKDRIPDPSQIALPTINIPVQKSYPPVVPVAVIFVIILMAMYGSRFTPLRRISVLTR